MTFTLSVTGEPIPQGSKSRSRTGHMYEANKRTAPWRKLVRARAEEKVAELGHEPYDGPLRVHIVFRMPRPKSHFGTGRNSALLRERAPWHPRSKPDIDKLARAILDALTTAGVWTDDCRVVELHLRKRYAGGGPEGGPGVLIDVEQLTDPAVP
jgi:crossover junction endodeoxyribonuclease RusA